MSKLSKDIQRIISSYSAQEASEIIAKMIEDESRLVQKIPYCDSVISCVHKHNGKCQTDEPCAARYFFITVAGIFQLRITKHEIIKIVIT